MTAGEILKRGSGRSAVDGHFRCGTSTAAPVIAGHKFDDAPGGSATPAKAAQKSLSTTNTLVVIGALSWGPEDRAVCDMGDSSLGNALARIGMN